MSPEQIVDGLIAVGRAVTPALHVIVSHHLARADAGPILLEGDGILPELVAGADFCDAAGNPLLVAASQIRSAFLVEEDEAALYQSLMGRSPEANSEAEAWQRRYAHASWLYGQWLHAEAQRFNLPVVAPRPYETLVTRLLTVLQVSISI